MSVGQVAFSVAADVAALDTLEAELAVGELDRGALHVASLRPVLRMHAVLSSSGMGFSTVPHAALAMGSSEHRAGKLLSEALGLAELPAGLEAVECGLLTVEQSGVLVAQLAPLPLEVRLRVWRRLQARLCEQGVLPPARLAELLRRWIGQADPEGVQDRRRAAEDGRRVGYRRREDGLADLFAWGFRGPDLQAILSRVAGRSAPVGIWDDRTADQRRFDALKDLLLGHESLPMEDERPACAAAGGAAPCGCLPGAPAPCGADVLVHVRWEATVGTSDEPAELVGHGPIEPDLLNELLLAAPGCGRCGPTSTVSRSRSTTAWSCRRGVIRGRCGRRCWSWPSGPRRRGSRGHLTTTYRRRPTAGHPVRQERPLGRRLRLRLRRSIRPASPVRTARRGGSGG